jgi:hypothetical protein
MSRVLRSIGFVMSRCVGGLGGFWLVLLGIRVHRSYIVDEQFLYSLSYTGDGSYLSREGM